MNFLADDEDDERDEPRPAQHVTNLEQRPASPIAQPTSHIFDPSQLSRPTPLAAAQTEVARAPNSVANILRPPPQIQASNYGSHLNVGQPQPTQRLSQPQPAQNVNTAPNVDVMALLIRGMTRSAQQQDRALLDHVRTCIKGKECTYPLCETAKEKFKHYKTCKDRKCFACLPSRLVWAKSCNKTTEDLDRRFRETRADLQKTLRALKISTDAVTEAKKGNDEAAISRATQNFNNEKALYADAKARYESLCVEVYTKWIEVAHLSDPSISRASEADGSLLSGNPSLQRVPAQMKLTSDAPGQIKIANSLTGVGVQPMHLNSIPGQAGTPSKVPTVAPSQPMIKRSEEILDGHTMEFVFGEVSAAILTELEATLEAGTLISTGKDDDWLKKRELVDEIEPEWVDHNILTKIEIETEQQILLKGAKRLFSNREAEYLSRAVQELVTDIVAECIQATKQRRMDGSDGFEIEEADVVSAIASRSALAKLC